MQDKTASAVYKRYIRCRPAHQMRKIKDNGIDTGWGQHRSVHNAT